MKLNRKGFTLVELLAVMIILVSISLVAVSNITESLVRREEKEYVEQQELAIGAAKIYFSLNNTSCVTVKILKEKNYFDNKNKYDLLDDLDVIRLSGDKYVFKEKSTGDRCS